MLLLWEQISGMLLDDLLDGYTRMGGIQLPEKLSDAVKDALMGLGIDDALLMSAISVWEVAKRVEKGRIKLSLGIDVWIVKALDTPQLRLTPLSPEISIESTRLPLPFHNDPADQIIVASARQLDATVLTVDRLIRSYSHVRSLW